MKPLLALLIIPLSAILAAAQSGGSYDLSHNVTAGGGTHSTGGSFDLTGTVGQPQAGTVSTGASYNLRGGFWAYDAFAPTAAPVSLNGRVILNGPMSMARVRVVLIQTNSGETRSVRPNQFGYYHFDGLEIGDYVVRAECDGYQFTPAQKFFSLVDDLMDANFEGFSFTTP
jgi:hypothetical protein